MKARPMKTMTEARIGALEKGRTTARSIAMPATKDTTTVTMKASQYG